MKQEELMQKLLDAFCAEHIALKALFIVLGERLDPGNPTGYDDLLEDFGLVYSRIRPQETAALAKDWGIPLSPELQADQGLDSAFEKWMRKELGEEGDNT